MVHHTHEGRVSPGVCTHMVHHTHEGRVSPGVCTHMVHHIHMDFCPPYPSRQSVTRDLHSHRFHLDLFCKIILIYSTYHDNCGNTYYIQDTVSILAKEPKSHLRQRMLLILGFTNWCKYALDLFTIASGPIPQPIKYLD
jgi:hypothetical protein